MKLNFALGIFGVLFSSLSSNAIAASYTPVGNTDAPGLPQKQEKISTSNLVGLKKGMFSSLMVETKGLKQDDKPAGLPVCANPPTVEDIGGDFEMNRYVMTKSTGAKLNIIGGAIGGGGEINADQLIAVFDFSRSKECIATDGKSRVVYGQSIRTVMTFASADAKADVTFPLVAASATIAGKTSTIGVKNIGFNDSNMAAKAATLSQIQFSVEKYDEFMKLHAELVALATNGNTQKKVERLGVISELDEDEIRSTLPTAFGIQQIKDGKSCVEAKAKYKPNTDTEALKAIEATYKYIAGTCESSLPSGVSIAKAKEYLRGMTVKN